MLVSSEVVAELNEIPRPNVNQDALEAGSTSSTIMYATTSEISFDDAIARSDLARAAVIATELMNSHEVLVDQGIYSGSMFHAAIKEISFPLYLRADPNWEWPTLTKQEDAIQQTGNDAVALLMFLKDWFEKLQAAEPDAATDQTIEKLRGDLGELVVFALITRNILGDDEDTLNILPATQQQDRGRINSQGKKTGIDFVVEHLQTKRKLGIQVKVGDAEADEYDPEIMVVVVQRLVNGKYPEVIELQEALIAEFLGDETMEQREIIWKAANSLHQEIYRRTSKIDLTRLLGNRP